jgi:two-component system, cell cycle sensor histidine kinase and response regulator CckA
MDAPQDEIVVLVADDEPSVRMLLQEILETEGYTVLPANDGIEALSLSRAFHGRIDLLITDLQMPGMSGVELARQVSHERPELRVILISSSKPVPFDERFPFLSKPFRMKELIAKVREVLGESSEKI